MFSFVIDHKKISLITTGNSLSYIYDKELTSERWLVNMSLTDEMAVKGEIRALVFA